MQAVNRVTIGELARQVGMRPSALRYYEAEGLLQPSAHTEAGYRLYDATAEQTLRFIQRAQRLGFTLTDIRVLLQQQRDGADLAAVRRVAERRYETLERQITPLLVLRHELALFLQDLQPTNAASLADHDALKYLMSRVCVDLHQSSTQQMLDWLCTSIGCRLMSTATIAALAPLKGQHIHLWQEGDDYQILVMSNDPQVGTALAQLAQLEMTCEVHAHRQQAPELQHNGQGYLLTARGAHAFLIARLLLSLEQEPPITEPAVPVHQHRLSEETKIPS